MTKEVPLKKESVVKLEKALNLWKSKNNSLMHQFVHSNRCKAQSEEQQNNVMFLGRKISRKDVHPNSLEDITITSQRLCEEYIEARLSRSGIKGFEERNNGNEYSNVLQNMGQILEIKYPRLYTKLSVHLKLTYDSEIVVWDSFNKFGSHLFSEGITWAKIIAFYAFTGGLALDCMKYGKNELPGRMVYWFGVFAVKKLAPWIQEQGGWNSLVSHFNTNNLSDNDDNDEDNTVDEYRENDFQRKMDRIKEFGENYRLAIIVVAIIFFLLMVVNNLIT